MRYLVILLVLGALITACEKEDNAQASEAPKAASITVPQPAEQRTSPAQRILTQSVFDCEDKTSFTAQFKASEMNIVSGKNPVVVLPQQMTASGFWYKNAQCELRGKGREAVLTIAGRKPIKCSTK